MKFLSKFFVLALASFFTFAIAGQAQAATPTTVSLGAAANYAILAGSGIINTGATTVSGDAGSSAIPTESGFGPGADAVTFSSGANHVDPNPNDDATQAAKVDLTKAYTDAAERTPTTTYTPIYDLGGATLTPGVYNDPSSFGITGTLTLDAQGDPSAVWIFQTGSTLITEPSSEVSLINGAQSCNIFWQVGSSSTLKTSSIFKGTIMALTFITLQTGVNADGGMLSQNGTVTLSSDTITASVCAAPQINVTKTATPTTLTSAGGSVTYDYSITNPGTVALSNIIISDDKCSVGGIVSGDTDSDSRLDTAETWKYACTVAITATITNTVTVSGTANGQTATKTATSTVTVDAATATTTGTTTTTGVAEATAATTTYTVAQVAVTATAAATATTTGTTGAIAVTATPGLPSTGNGASDNNLRYVLLSFLVVSLSIISTAVVMKRKVTSVR